MNILKEKLNEMFEKNQQLVVRYTLEQTYDNLNRFLKSEIKDSGKKFMSPYEYAKQCGESVPNALTLFFYLASQQEGVLKIRYRYTCSHGNDTFMYEDELQDFVCDEDCGCDEAFDLKEMIESGAIDVPVFFEPHPQIKSEVFNT